jgi:hypothetical protein
MNEPIIVFNSLWSTEEDQKEMQTKLAIRHDFGDSFSILPDNQELKGHEEHSVWASNELRIKTRKRVTLCEIKAHSSGFGQYKKKNDIDVLCAFLCVPDWQAPFLEVETYFLRLDNYANGPRIGPYVFEFGSYMTCIYEDAKMCLQALQGCSHGTGRKLHLKIAPLGIGPTIKTRNGDFIAPFVVPSYLLAMQFVLTEFIDESWIDTLEFVDFTKTLSPFISKPNVRILTGSRDVLDFQGHKAVPCILVPCDAFLKIGYGTKSVVSTIGQNSNLLEVLKGQIKYMPC